MPNLEKSFFLPARFFPVRIGTFSTDDGWLINKVDTKLTYYSKYRRVV